MNIDPIIKDAIETSVSNNGQTAILANKIVSWFEALSEDRENIEEKNDTEGRIEMLYDTVQIPTNQDDS